ncbi:MAG: hydrogenase maturation protease [Bacteroidales bacterium]|nr:hydrogenase maturation protease [Bacteroidales bacterium]
MKILFYGYGNPGRQDDGLGIKFIEETEKWISENNFKNIDTDSNYQLNIEDAEKISHYDVVYFVDATMENIDNFELTKVAPDTGKAEFTTHSVSPEYVLGLCKNIFNKTPETYLLHIKGYEWEMKEELSEKAKMNLSEAIEFLKNKIIPEAKLNQ